MSGGQGLPSMMSDIDGCVREITARVERFHSRKLRSLTLLMLRMSYSSYPNRFDVDIELFLSKTKAALGYET